MHSWGFSPDGGRQRAKQVVRQAKQHQVRSVTGNMGNALGTRRAQVPTAAARGRAQVKFPRQWRRASTGPAVHGADVFLAIRGGNYNDPDRMKLLRVQPSGDMDIPVGNYRSISH